MAKSISNEPLRFVTATSLFDGHDVSINIIRRMLQDAGAEVIHLGHNRSVNEIVDACVQEGVQGVAISSYQGGHMEFFRYLIDLLRDRGCRHIKVFGGGGGVILPEEIQELEAYGVTKIYSPADGREMGLKGMIDHMIDHASRVEFPDIEGRMKDGLVSDPVVLGRLISLAEADIFNKGERFEPFKPFLKRSMSKSPVVGITGTGGSGKSSFIDEIVRRFLLYYKKKRLAVVSVDPSRTKSGGALLGDRIRMNHIDSSRVFMRSMATRLSGGELSEAIHDAIDVMQAGAYDLIIVETSGIGQGDAAVAGISDVSIYVMTSEYGAPSQLEKVDMLDFADMVVINKFEKRHSMDALRDVKKQFMRNHGFFDLPYEDLPVFGTMASRFDDPGTDRVFSFMIQTLAKKRLVDWDVPDAPDKAGDRIVHSIVPVGRETYLREIAHSIREYHAHTREAAGRIHRLSTLQEVLADMDASLETEGISKEVSRIKDLVDPEDIKDLEAWKVLSERYKGKTSTYEVRGKKIRVPLTRESLSGLDVPRVALPAFIDDGELFRWMRKENLPGFFPFTSGVFPFKRDWEDPKRQFAGEGTPEKTNRRFHYLCSDDEAVRLSTAFDSVTLYGEDPNKRPDIFGKIGESGVSVCTLEDIKKLYYGFDLCAPSTSVSMTINGPAPIMTAMFFNAAIDQRVDEIQKQRNEEVSAAEYAGIRERVLSNIRGTVQADILKEDQGQNTCLMSTDFSIRLMGDMQEYFIDNRINNFYSVSISGYHIAEAGANPVSQLAFTLANGFTYVEYYRSRGMDASEFASNFSFFFSSGMDPEYSVLARVARRIWSIAMRDVYHADQGAQRLKCHVQTSGRSLHSEEIQFNDIRTTLQALTALNDNCNSLHTNAYDEAITTPTEESVRRAMAIQLIINREFGPAKNENPYQGSFFMEWLTDELEEAVLREFERISDRNGVLGAMEAHYQRSRIQEESMYYEHLKHSGKLPIIGVNTYTAPAPGDKTARDADVMEVTRATLEEKTAQLDNLNAFIEKNRSAAPQALKSLQQVALSGGNIFEELMDTVRVASLGQITHALFEVGGKYRRNM
ncbi:MAG: fused isobutyryl-CoA mutase/GTPase IcmF [Thermodesulfobacteriota bacterium]|nr:fused isobutyryl-CoA mutase/GTPase IcmF [Thermodesulfobacteriota bacterium]